MKDFSYRLLKKTLDVSSLRQRTISSNITNFNTPDYKANRVAFEELLSKAKNEISLKKTNDKHFGIDSLDDIGIKAKKSTNSSLNDNGNNVDVDIEMTELVANEIYYGALVRQLNSKLSNLSYVINRT